MSSPQLHLLNANDALKRHTSTIHKSFAIATAISETKLNIGPVDIVVRDEPSFAIPEIGVGGFTSFNGHSIYISLDSSKKISSKDLLATFLHELHHAKRFQLLGAGETFGDRLINEGLACLFEEEELGAQPIYTKIQINRGHIDQAKKIINSKKYNHNEWFFGSKTIPRWFGYAYGYSLAKERAMETNQSSADMIGARTSAFLKD